MPVPVWAERLIALAKQRPGVAILVALLGAGGLYWLARPAPPLPQPLPAKAQAIPGLGGQRDVMTETFIKLQKNNESLETKVTELERTLRGTQQAQAATEQERKATAAAQAKQFEEQLQRALEQAKKTGKATTGADEKKSAPASALLAAKPLGPASAPPAPLRKTVITIFRNSKPPSFQSQDPTANRGETAYLPAASIAEGRVATGIVASQKTSVMGGIMMFTIDRPFLSPEQLHGPGRDSTPTAVPVQGCRLFGKGVADLASQRVIGQLFLLSCVFPDKSTFEHPVHGYVVDADNRLGLLGIIERHDSAVMARAAAAALIQELSAAFGLAKSSIVVTQSGGAQLGQATQSIVSEIGRYYLEQARELGPTLLVEAQRPARFVLLEGVELPGFPVRILSAQKEGLP